MSKTFDWLVDLVYPNRCPFCERFIPWDQKVCEDCEKELEAADFCPKCGQINCKCQKSTVFYDGCAVVYQYSGAARSGVLSLKYKNGFGAARFIVPKLHDRLCELGFANGADIVTAVPMTKKRFRETGYNHAEYIARLLGRRMGLPCDFRLIGKTASAQTQHRLTAEERRIAAASSYFAKGRRIDGKTVILCDDIITTGSTLSECAGVLKKIGAKNVYCAALTGTVFTPQEDINVGT